MLSVGDPTESARAQVQIIWVQAGAEVTIQVYASRAIIVLTSELVGRSL